MSAQHSHLVVYDGVCMLCNHMVQYLLKNDQQQLLTFSTFQGLPDVISKNGLHFPLEESISYYRKGRWWQQSSAVLMIYKDVFGPWHWSQLAWVFPRFLRDFVYRIVAKNRYRWFGKHAHCVLPTAAQRDRFIG
jgi:predicted DCC family thiol-disulfide oxidoreductase YuxK